MQNKSDMRGVVVDLLKANIPASYHYHNYRHTLYVQENALLIGSHEHCAQEELELLDVAALWHDTGFIKVYTNHEDAGCALAREHLPEYGMSEKEIDRVCGMIMATKIPQSPKNKLEEILVDADLIYLGTSRAGEVSELLFRELQAIDPSLQKAEWNRRQIDFLERHQFFTEYCRKNNEPVKQAYLKKLIESS